MSESRNTNQREIIKKEVQNYKSHVTADQIYESLKEKHPTISRATVFRNLKTLVELGEIGFVPTSDGADCFDYRIHEHYHFKCKVCRRVLDTDIVYDKSLDKKSMTLKIDNHVTLFYGTCSMCSKK